MGITKFDVELIDKSLAICPGIKTVCELGSQNLYLDNDPNPPFASNLYKSKGLEYSCIDLAGDNGASQLDLSRDQKFRKSFDLITDFGTSEHVVQMSQYQKVAFHGGHINSIYPDKNGIENIELGFYNCWLNKHKLLNIGGLMINMNPKTGHWPEHGYSYYTKDFYIGLCKIAGYTILEIGEHAAMGNTVNGVNIYSILKKESDLFPDFDQFKTLDIKKS